MVLAPAILAECMSFVIVGGGRVGLRTARILQEQGYGVVIVEQAPEKVERIRNEGFRVIEGDGADADILEDAGIETAGAVAGLTGDLNTNFAACMLGKEYGCRTLLRIDEDYREAIYEKYASEVDEIIYPEQLGAQGAKTALLGGNFNLIADLTEELQLFTVRLSEASPMIGRRVNEISSLVGPNARVYAHGRARDPLTIPLPGTRIEPGDRLAVIADTEAADSVRETLLDEADEPEPTPE